ncbi:M90 family metallopeptidase [Azohydromonas sp.]|uniref:M90 family metallopeptidase n=1 Tax=Azohydromonas sp. TaxID=1872666 RepID=UPI002B5EABDA|nr:M90 family metallopeptidase [Azohydromonas sp.]HMM85793.1 zinc-dependent peptidase [Azohydromonas sp.]
MFGRWLQRWRLRREWLALARRDIPDALWQRTLQRYPFLVRRSDTDVAELRRLASLFLDRKEFSGAGGFVVDDATAVAIAAQACLPVLRLGLAAYDGFVGIVVHPSQVVARREVTDEHGVVHRYDEVLAGEAMEGGPVMLSWADVDAAGDAEAEAYNVVIHEFAHVIDMLDGEADGMPPLHDAKAMAHWDEVLQYAYDRFCERVACGHDTVLDPYGAESPGEFFAVASEAFFVTPLAMKDEQPELYRLFVEFYRQDPAATA